MTKHKYKPQDRVIIRNGNIGTIQENTTAWYDGEVIPSYWIIFPKSLIRDGCARHILESSIRDLTPEKKPWYKRIFNI